MVLVNWLRSDHIFLSLENCSVRLLCSVYFLDTKGIGINFVNRFFFTQTYYAHSKSLFVVILKLLEKQIHPMLFKQSVFFPIYLILKDMCWPFKFTCDWTVFALFDSTYWIIYGLVNLLHQPIKILLLVILACLFFNILLWFNWYLIIRALIYFKNLLFLLTRWTIYIGGWVNLFVVLIVHLCVLMESLQLKIINGVFIIIFKL